MRREQMQENSKRNFLSSYTRMEKKNFKFVALLLIFPILQFLVFYVYINFSSFVLAFTNQYGEFDMKYMEIIFKEFGRTDGSSLWVYLFRSVGQWAISTFINFPITILFTYVLFKHVKGEMFFRVLFYLPNIIGTVVFASLYYHIVAADGPLFVLLDLFNIPISEELQLFGFLDYENTSLSSVIIFGIWLALGGNTIVLTGAMTRIPEEIFESGRLEGIGIWREFFQMVCPLIWSTISTLLIFQLAAITTFDFGTFLLMGESAAQSVRTMGYNIFMLTYNVSRGAEVANKPAALGLIITIVTVPIVMICRAIIEKVTDPVEF